MTRAIASLLFVLACTLAACGKSSGTGAEAPVADTPISVTERHFDCLIRGDLDGVLATSEGERAAMFAPPNGESAVEGFVTMFQQFTIDRVEASDENITGDSATVLMRFMPRDPSSHVAPAFSLPVEIRLQKFDGKWKVVGT
jgi:hypothetical protein